MRPAKALLAMAVMALAGAASAAPTVSFTWTACAGVGCGAGVGTNSITAGVGDTLTLQIQVNPDSNNVTFAGLSYDFSAGGSVVAVTQAGVGSIDDDLGNVLSTQNGNLASGSALYTGSGLSFVGGATTCPAGVGNIIAGLCGDWPGPFAGSVSVGALLPDGTLGTFAIGRLVAPGITGTFTLAEAQFEIMPESATGGLLVFGLGGLAFIRRRRAR